MHKLKNTKTETATNAPRTTHSGAGFFYFFFYMVGGPEGHKQIQLVHEPFFLYGGWARSSQAHHRPQPPAKNNIIFNNSKLSKLSHLG